MIAVLGVGISTASTSRADTEAVVAAIDALFDVHVASGPVGAEGREADERVARALEAARPVLMHRLRVLSNVRLLASADRVLASYTSLIDPRATGSTPTHRGLASGVAEDLAVVVRWGDLETARAVAPAANVIAAIDLVVTNRRHRREVADGIAPRPADDEVAIMVARRLKELLQLDYDLVGAEGLETDGVESTRAGKKLAKFEGDPAALIARHVLRRMVALGHTQVTDPRRGVGRIVSVP
jgi:hypothetical protein